MTSKMADPKRDFLRKYILAYKPANIPEMAKAIGLDIEACRREVSDLGLKLPTAFNAPSEELRKLIIDELDGEENPNLEDTIIRTGASSYFVTKVCQQEGIKLSTTRKLKVYGDWVPPYELLKKDEPMEVLPPQAHPVQGQPLIRKKNQATYVTFPATPDRTPDDSTPPVELGTSQPQPVAETPSSDNAAYVDLYLTRRGYVKSVNDFKLLEGRLPMGAETHKMVRAIDGHLYQVVSFTPVEVVDTDKAKVMNILEGLTDAQRQALKDALLQA